MWQAVVIEMLSGILLFLLIIFGAAVMHKRLKKEDTER